MSRLIPICERGSFISLPFPHRWNSQRLHECYCSKDERNPPTCATRHLALITKTTDLFLPCQLCSFMFKPQSFFGHLSGWTDWAWYSGVRGLMKVSSLRFFLKFALECSSWRFFLSPQDSSWSLLLKAISEGSSWSFPALCRCFISTAQMRGWRSERFCKVKGLSPAVQSSDRENRWKNSRAIHVAKMWWEITRWRKRKRTREWTKQMEKDEWEWPTAPQQPNICLSGLTSERRRGLLSPARPSPWS